MKQLYLFALLLMTGAAVAPALLAKSEPSTCLMKKNYVPVAQQSLSSMAYIVENCTGDVKNYVVGTLHSSSNEVYDSIRYTLPALKSSDVAWFEIVAQPGDELKIAQFMLKPPSAPGLKEQLGAGMFGRLHTLVNEHIATLPESYLDRYQPWAVAVMLQTAGVDMSGKVLDDWLQAQALQRGVEVKSLETMAEQFSVFSTLTPDQALNMLTESIEEFDSLQATSDEMQALYLNGSLRKLADHSDDILASIEDSSLREVLEDELVHKRNQRMVDVLEASFQEGDAFVAVGALHLPGKTGILQSFERKGYFVIPMNKPN